MDSDPDPNPLDQIEALSRQATQAYQQGNTNLALDFARRAHELAQQTLDPGHPLARQALSNLGNLYFMVEDYDQAETLFWQEIEIQQQQIAQEQFDLAALLHKQARLYSTRRFEQAQELFEQATNILNAIGAGETEEAGHTWNDQAANLEKMGRGEAAEKAFQQALKILQQVYTPPHPDLAGLLQHIGRFYADAGRYPQAEDFTRRAAEMFETALGRETPNYAGALYNLGGIYKQWGRRQEAQTYLEQAMEIQRQLPGEEALQAVRSSDLLAEIYSEQGRFDQARRMLEDNRALLESLPQAPYPLLPVTLSHLGELYLDLGDYPTAEQAYLQVLEFTRQAEGEDSLDYAGGLFYLGGLRRAQGNYAAAERLYRQALEIRRARLGPDHPDLIGSLNKLADLYGESANLEAAEDLLKEALHIVEQAGLQQASVYGDTLNYLALVWMQRRQYEQAEALFQQALQVYRESLGGRDSLSGKVLGNLGTLHRMQGDYAAAKTYAKQALQIHQDLFGADHPLVSTGLNNLALALIDGNDYTGAEECYHRSLEIKRRLMGAQHPSLAVALANLSSLRARQGDYAQALAYADEALHIDDHMTGQIFSVGSEQRRLAYVQEFIGDFQAMLSIVTGGLSNNPQAVRLAADWTLRRKALGAEALAVQREIALGERAAELAPLLEALHTVRRRLAARILNGPGELAPEEYQSLLSEWNAEKERLEAELARSIPEINLEQKLRAVDAEAVCAALPVDSALVEFVRHYPFDFDAPRSGPSWKAPRYLAFVLLARRPEALNMLDLGEADEIDRLVQDFRRSFGAEASLREVEDDQMSDLAPDSQTGGHLAAAVFAPLMHALVGCTRLFISPDGELARLPFETLPLSDGQRVIDVYTLSYLSAGRDLLRLEQPGMAQPGLPVVIADPQFDLGTAAGEVPDAVEPPGRRSQDMERGGLYFRRLPGTRREGEQVATLLGVQPWLEAQALEAPLKALRSPRLLHLATHGFFLKDQRLLRAPVGEPIDTSAPPPGLENPLLRSGLALAGANTWLQHDDLPPEAEDGLLTAEDVTGMDLSATELVVLSACETGLGQVQIGEGVFGLRRAFVLAGAKTLVISLWKVPDQQTQELMGLFYTALLAGQPRAKALRQAQIEIKRHYPNPLYWGAFICQGDPSPLG